MSGPSGEAAQLLPRLLAGLTRDGRPASLDQHVAAHGRLPHAARPGRGGDDALIETVRRAGLLGRGGAAFPTYRKLQSVADRRGSRVVLVNGAEGEPASRKDRTLLTRCPHLVLDGATVAARAVGASRVIVATKAAHTAAVAAAVAERTRYGLDPVPFEICTVANRFVAGEETALVSAANGGPGLPTFVPPRPFERGVGGQPTLVNNVETLAHLALIARHGAEWFRAVGTDSEPGSTLITLSGAVARPGVYEAARGSSMDSLLAGAGGPTAPLQALLIGGYAGAWVPAGRALQASISNGSLSEIGGLLAAGVVIALPAHSCGLVETAAILGYLADQTAGQCGPCLHGLAAIAGAAEQFARGAPSTGLLERLEVWAWQVTGRGACHHPDGATRLLASALRTFSVDVDQHRTGGPCRAAGASPGMAADHGRRAGQPVVR